MTYIRIVKTAYGFNNLGRYETVLKSKEIRINNPTSILARKYLSLDRLGLLNESHPRVFQTITLSFFIAFKARQG